MKIYSTSYTDERLIREDNVKNRDGELFYKFRGEESREAYYFTPEHFEAYFVEVAG